MANNGEKFEGVLVVLVLVIVIFIVAIGAALIPTREPNLEESAWKNTKMFHDLRKKIKKYLRRNLWRSDPWGQSNGDIINLEAKALKENLIESTKAVFGVLRPLVSTLAKIVLKMQAAGKTLVPEGEMEEITRVIMEMEKRKALGPAGPQKAAKFREAAKRSVERSVEVLNRVLHKNCSQPRYRSSDEYLNDLRERVGAKLRSHYTVKKNRMLNRNTRGSTVFRARSDFGWEHRYRDHRSYTYNPGYSYAYDSGYSYTYDPNLETELANMEHEQEYFEDFLKKAFAALEESFGSLSFPEEEQEAMLYLLNAGNKELLRIVASGLFPGLGWDSWWGYIGLL